LDPHIVADNMNQLTVWWQIIPWLSFTGCQCCSLLDRLYHAAFKGFQRS